MPEGGSGRPRMEVSDRSFVPGPNLARTYGKTLGLPQATNIVLKKVLHATASPNRNGEQRKLVGGRCHSTHENDFTLSLFIHPQFVMILLYGTISCKL